MTEKEYNEIIGLLSYRDDIHIDYLTVKGESSGNISKIYIRYIFNESDKPAFFIIEQDFNFDKIWIRYKDNFEVGRGKTRWILEHKEKMTDFVYSEINWGNIVKRIEEILDRLDKAVRELRKVEKIEKIRGIGKDEEVG